MLDAAPFTDAHTVAPTHQPIALPVHRLWLAPPIGSRLSLPGATSVLGSFTAMPRPGLIPQILRTLRPTRHGGWVNAIGLRNVGLAHAPRPSADRRAVLSLAALSAKDWQIMADLLAARRDAGHHDPVIEFNLSCPNAAIAGLTPDVVNLFRAHHLIAKLPPKWTSLDLAADLLDQGIVGLHLTNTWPTRRGGLSGPPIHRRSLRLVQRARQRFGDRVHITGGGGVVDAEAAQRFLDAGADSVAVSSALLNPLRGLALLRGLRRAGIWDPAA